MMILLCIISPVHSSISEGFVIEYSSFTPKLKNISQPSKVDTNTHKPSLYNIDLHPYLSLFTIISGISTLSGGGSPDYTVATSTWVLSGRIPIYQKKIYLYAQLRASFFLGQSSFPLSTVLPIIQMENSKLGGLFGLGGIVGDWRVNQLGWQIALNGGFVFEGGIANSFIPFKGATAQFIAFGPEINVMSHYSFHKFFTLNIGFHLGYRFNPFSGDPFYLDRMENSTYFHTIEYGFSVGIAF